MIRNFFNILAFVGIISISYASSHRLLEEDDDYLSWETSSSVSSVGYEGAVDDLSNFSATSFPADRSGQPVSSPLLDVGDLSGLFQSEGDTVLLGVQRQLASQQQDINLLKARLALLVHQSASKNEPIMLVEDGPSTAQEVGNAFKKSYESLSFKEKIIYKIKVVKEKIKNFYHKHFDTIVKGAIAVAFKIAGLILIALL